MKYYHGGQRRRSYFEGWYFKYQTRDGRALAVIPALHIGRTGQPSASLQVISDGGAWWIDYPETAFSASERQFQIRMGKSHFCEEGIELHVERENLSLRGALRHGSFTPLKSDIMGPFRLFSRMECSHGVISMGHGLEGALTLNGDMLDFTGGIGYVETDRGRSFPEAYLWTQCAWQSTQRSSLMLSIASIPLGLGKRFTGCICAVVHNGQEYRLATYHGAKIETWSASGAVIRQGKYRLAVTVLETQSRPLKAPVEGGMSRIIHESLSAKVRYRFWAGNALLFDHIDYCAGFEYADAGAA